MSSGFAALMFALYLGPANKEQSPGRSSVHGAAQSGPANVPLVVLGTSLLWFGWFGVSAWQGGGGRGAL